MDRTALLDELREQARRTWALGDYRRIATHLAPAAEGLVELAGVGPAQRVLDVGTGTGNLAIAAARRGASVTALDIGDAWFATVRERAAREDVALELVLGDAQDLPCDSGVFDAVLSSFAAVFAPDHALVAAELTRVTRPGGVIGLAAWPAGTPDHPRVFDAIRERMPAPPPWMGVSSDWADIAYVERRFTDRVVGWRSETHHLDWHLPDIAALEELVTDASGPLIAARPVLEELGRWDEALEDLRDRARRQNLATDGSLHLRTPYRLLVGQRR